MNTLYVLAGNGGHAGLWQDLQPHVRCWQLQPVELPGFGCNMQPPCVGLDAWTQALLHQTRPGQVILACGVSAILALQAQRRAPGHFTHIILVGPVGARLGERTLPWLLRLPGLAAIARLLLGWLPGLFRRPFAGLGAEARQRLALGYRRCRAFSAWFRDIRADNALDQLEWLDTPVDIVWGGRDGVQPAAMAAAWSAILARAPLRVWTRDDWGHYPWLEDAPAFGEWLDALQGSGDCPPLSERLQCLNGHSKAGRLQLAALAGLPVPPTLVLQGEEPVPPLAPGRYAVRSSTAGEDGADHSGAGLSLSLLRVEARDVAAQLTQLRARGVREIVIQPFIEPRVSGVAHVRYLGAEVEWVAGHLQSLVDGSHTPQRCQLARLGPPWGSRPEAAGALNGLPALQLWDFLQTAIRAFHWQHADIEWAWDGQRLYLLQLRPVTVAGWRRYLSSANLDEILPPQPSRLMEYAQRRAAGAIPALLARWDGRVLRDSEPFTARWQDASYLNLDGLLACLLRWGLPTGRLAQEIGGQVPRRGWQLQRLLRQGPRLLRMHFASRRALGQLEADVRQWQTELQALPSDADRLVHWFSVRYVDMVRGNLLLALAIGSALATLPGRVAPLYRLLDGDAIHRLPWESDPATPRDWQRPAPALQAAPAWPAWLRGCHWLGLPGMQGHYRALREWYRDNLMRLFFALHQRLQECAREQASAGEWLQPVSGVRSRHGSFWQSGEHDQQPSQRLLLSPGTAEGVLGEEILLEEALDPGRWQVYGAARAIVVRCGGRLSHGATLVRELGVPAAVIPDVDPRWRGQRVRFDQGQLQLLLE